MYPFIVTVDYYDDSKTIWDLTHINLLIYAETFAQAAARIEDGNYVSNIENIHVLSAGEEGSYFEIPDEMIDIFTLGGGSYTDGAEIIEKGTKR